MDALEVVNAGANAGYPYLFRLNVYGGGSSRYGRTKVAYQTINHFAK